MLNGFPVFSKYWAQSGDGERMAKVSGDHDLDAEFQMFENYQVRLFGMAELRPPQQPENSYRRLKTPAIFAWFHTNEAMVMLLTNNTIQINFTETHDKLLVCKNPESLTFIQPSKTEPIFTSLNIRSFVDAELSDRTFEMLKFFTSVLGYLVQKWKIQGNSY